MPPKKLQKHNKHDGKESGDASGPSSGRGGPSGAERETALQMLVKLDHLVLIEVDPLVDLQLAKVF